MSPTGAKGDLIYCVWCTTLTGSQLIELIPQGPLQARGRRTFPSRLVQNFAASVVLLSPPSPNIRHQPQLQRGCGLHELFLPVTLTALQAGAVSGLSRCFGVRMEFYPNLAVWRLLLSLVRPPEHSHHSSTRRSLALSCFLPSLRCSSELFHLCSRSLLFGWGTLAGIFSLCLVSLEELSAQESHSKDYSWDFH